MTGEFDLVVRMAEEHGYGGGGSYAQIELRLMLDLGASHSRNGSGPPSSSSSSLAFLSPRHVLHPYYKLLRDNPSTILKLDDKGVGGSSTRTRKQEQSDGLRKRVTSGTTGKVNNLRRNIQKKSSSSSLSVLQGYDSDSDSSDNATSVEELDIEKEKEEEGEGESGKKKKEKQQRDTKTVAHGWSDKRGGRREGIRVEQKQSTTLMIKKVVERKVKEERLARARSLRAHFILKTTSASASSSSSSSSS